MSKRPCFSHDNFPLFHSEFDLWKSLDESVRQQVLDGLGLLLLQYISQTACGADEESFPKKGNQ
jgi:hypothetical protein